MFVVVVGLMVVPLQMALIPILRLYTAGRRSAASRSSPTSTSTAVPRHLARPHRLRPAARHLPAVELHRVAAVVDHRVGQDRRRRPLHDLLAPGRPAVGAGACRLRHLPVPLGLERPARRLCVPRRHPEHAGDHHRAGRPRRLPRRGLAPADRRPRSSRWRYRSRCSSPCSATSSGASPPARSRDEDSASADPAGPRAAHPAAQVAGDRRRHAPARLRPSGRSWSGSWPRLTTTAAARRPRRPSRSGSR